MEGAVKKCKVCSITKPIEDFPITVPRLRATGEMKRYRLTLCRDCQNKAVRNNSALKKAKAKYQRGYSRRDPIEFKRKKDASRRANPAAHKARGTRWIAANQEKRRVTVIACEHKRRDAKWRKNRGPCRVAVSETLELARFGDKYLDAYSGELIDKPTIDHVTPLSRGGTNGAENLCITSLENNSSKHNQLLIVWLARRTRH